MRENTKGKGENRAGGKSRKRRDTNGMEENQARVNTKEKGKNMMGKGENRVARKHEEKREKSGAQELQGERGKLGAQGHQGAKTRRRKGREENRVAREHEGERRNYRPRDYSNGKGENRLA